MIATDADGDLADLVARLEEFKSLEAGWLNGEGLAYEAAKLDWLAETLADRSSRLGLDLRLRPNCGFVASPRIDCRVIFEWMKNDCMISLDIDLNLRVGVWNVLLLDCERGADEEAAALDLDGDEDWLWLRRRLDAIFRRHLCRTLDFDEPVPSRPIPSVFNQTSL